MNPFEVLKVPGNATPEEIQAAYHRLAKQWHPDRFQGPEQADAERRFREVALAFAALKDPAQREALRGTPVSRGTPREGRSPEGWAKLAQAALDQGQLSQARSHLHQAIRLAGPGHGHHALLASLLEAEGADPRRVIRALEDAVRAQPQDAESHLRLAERFQALGLSRRAQRHLNQAQRLAPRHARMPRPAGWTWVPSWTWLHRAWDWVLMRSGRVGFSPRPPRAGP
jgi:curved DNA-binding protein CbpA